MRRCGLSGWLEHTIADSWMVQHSPPKDWHHFTLSWVWFLCCNWWYYQTFNFFVNIIGKKCYLAGFLYALKLISNQFGYLFTYLLAIEVPSFVNLHIVCPFFYLFSNWIVVFLCRKHIADCFIVCDWLNKFVWCFCPEISSGSYLSVFVFRILAVCVCVCFKCFPPKVIKIISYIFF